LEKKKNPGARLSLLSVFIIPAHPLSPTWEHCSKVVNLEKMISVFSVLSITWSLLYIHMLP
jgi:type III secretory pathway component EscU